MRFLECIYNYGSHCNNNNNNNKGPISSCQKLGTRSDYATMNGL